MGCLNMTIELVEAGSLLVSASPQLTMQTELEPPSSLIVEAHPQLELSLDVMDEPQMTLHLCNDVLSMELSEVCSVEQDPMTVLCASDGILYFSNGDYILLDDDDEEE